MRRTAVLTLLAICSTWVVVAAQSAVKVTLKHANNDHEARTKSMLERVLAD